MASGITGSSAPSPLVSAARPAATPSAIGVQRRSGRNTASARKPTSMKMYIVSERNSPVKKIGAGRIANENPATRPAALPRASRASR